jgi:hypothetical protein
MTRIVNGIVVIEPTTPEKCEYCGKIAECRPYGENNKAICFKCAMKPENREIADKKLEELFNQAKLINPIKN